MTTKLNRSVFLAAGFVLAGCAQQPQTASVTQPPLVTQPTVGQEIGAVAQNNLLITFPEGGFRLSPEANRQLDVAARLFRDINPVMMYSIGYADTIGDEFSNIVLSARRARAVKLGLVARGIPADRVQLQAFGESDLADPNDPHAADNRRVVVKWRVV